MRDHFDNWYESCMNTADIVGLLPQDEGVSFFSLSKETFAGGYLMWVDGVCIDANCHARGAGRAAITDALAFMDRGPIKWVGGRTQSPFFARLLQKLGTTRPLDKTYEDEEGQAMISFLAKEVGQLKGLEGFKAHNGVCPGAYPAPFYPPDLKDKYFLPDYDPDKGDTAVCVCEI